MKILKITLFQDSSDSLMHFQKKKRDSLMMIIYFIVFYVCNSNSFTYLKKKKNPFDMFSTTQLRAPRGQEHISKGLLKGTK